MDKNGKYRLEVRKKSVARILADLCHSSSLSKILGRNRAWAIVGGAVRDSLLAEDPHTPPFFNLWPDVDVAVSGYDFEANAELSTIEEVRVSVKRNSFGGWKVSTADAGELDVWRVDLDYVNHGAMDRWLAYLDCVDFTINAVAFSWPECTVAVHPRWHDSVERRMVSRLSPTSTMKHLQGIRGVALAVKMEMTTGLKFSLADNVKEDLEWLVNNNNLDLMRQSLEYLHRKVSAGRWPRLTVQRLLHEAVDMAYAHAFAQLVEEMFRENVAAYATARSRTCCSRPRAHRQLRLFPRPTAER